MAAALRLEVDGWESELDTLMVRVGRWFARPQTRRTARDVVNGLLADLPRKNGWTLGEHAGHRTPDRIQHLLSRAKWDDAAVRREIGAYVAENLTAGVDPDLVTLVFDETGDQKKGSHTVGTQRQYSGTCGRIENCQLAVFATLATPRGHAFIDVELYLPKSWTDNPDRLTIAGVPDDVEFATKPELALRMADRALTAGVGVGWIAADEAYGDNTALRHALEGRGLNYVMAVSCNTQIPTSAGALRADRLVSQIPAEGWQILSAGSGSKGERLYDWAITTITDTADQQHRWLLIRRNPCTGELAYFRCHATTSVPLQTLVRVAGTRWKVEENFQAGKGCAGLDEHQVRTWTSWHRWTTLAMLAHAFLAVTAANHRPDSTEPTNEKDMIPPYLQRNPTQTCRLHLTRPPPQPH
ncbi:IS701 family transposase [Actinopolymorpha pittospori]|uniref:SRSO17 transposase n=1 Tax=Actinopolymorpha pittospori TaxID=648752 RepID=A0A927MN60_9ACTN|nr:SRSO17 transposase [Actinopolymorpha pittospori]